MAGVLFQGAGQQKAAAISDLTQTLFKGAMTIYGKLDEAETISQFNVGQTQLQNAMNQFDYDRSTKGATDFLNWQDQNTKAMDDAWATVEKTVPNQGAKNQLNDWWQGQKIGRSKKIEDETIRARINVGGEQYDYLRKKTIEDSSIDVDSKVSKLTTFAQQYADMGYVDAKKAQDQLWVDAHGLYKNANLTAIIKKMDELGTRSGFDWGNDPNSDYGQMLTPEDRYANAEAAKRSRQASLTMQKQDALTQNEEALTEVVSLVSSKSIPKDITARIAGKAEKPEDNIKWGPDIMDGPAHFYGPSVQQQQAMKMAENKTKFDPTTPYTFQWDNLAATDRTQKAQDDLMNKFDDENPEATTTQRKALRSYLKTIRAGGGGSEKPTTEQWATYGAIKEKIYGRDEDYSISNMVSDINGALDSGKIIGTQYNELLSLTGQAKNKDVAEVMGQLSKGLAHNDPVTGQPVGWYDSEVYGKIMSMTDDYIAAQHDTKGVSTIDAQKLHAYVDELTNKTMDAAISDYLNGQYVSPIKFLGISFGEKLDNDKISSALAAFSSKDTYTTGQGKSVMGVLKADLGETLAKKGITGDLNVGNFNGTIYPALIAKDGIYGYFTEKGAAVIKKSTDGKTWQTIK